MQESQLTLDQGKVKPNDSVAESNHSLKGARAKLAAMQKPQTEEDPRNVVGFLNE